MNGGGKTVRTTDLQSQILDACRAHLSWRTNWDEVPEVLVIKRHSDTGLTVQQLPVPDLLWDMFPPAEVIGALANASVHIGSVVTDDTVALAVRTEAFTITSDASPQAAEAIRRHRVGGSVPSNEYIPGRVEQRCINVVDRSGRQFLVTADRQDDGSTAPAVSHAVSGSWQVGGAIPEALNVFSRAVWLTPAPRQDSSGTDRRHPSVPGEDE